MVASARRLLPLLLWTGILAATTTALLTGRGRLDKAHVALALLLVVLFGAAAAGRVVGLWLASTSFLAFNWFFLPPYGTFVIHDPLDWLVLGAFLVTGVVAAQLLARAQLRTALAIERAAEVDRLATLGAETLNVARAEEALDAIADVIRSATRAERCEVLERGDHGSLVDSVATTGTAALEHTDGTARRLDAARPGPAAVRELEAGGVRALLLPLRVRDRTVGVLRLASDGALRLDPERWRFVDALSYYAALALERVRLVTEAEHAEALREADRLKDALLASVSHDLRTPLTTIKALAHRRAEGGDEDAITIEEAADRLNRLVADLLDLSRLNAGALTLRVELNAVDELLGAVLEQVEPSLGGRRIAVSLPPDDPVLLGLFDLSQTVRILANLVENAAKYAPGGAPIEVRAARRGDAIAIEVADRGPGVPEPEVKRIFEPFYRHPAASPDVGGAGLGLSIARRLAEAQQGSLEYERRAGGGSVFTVRLPAAELDVSDVRA